MLAKTKWKLNVSNCKDATFQYTSVQPTTNQRPKRTKRNRKRTNKEPTLQRENRKRQGRHEENIQGARSRKLKYSNFHIQTKK